MKYLYLLLAITIVVSAQAKEAYIENKGQIIDQNRVPNSSVLYLYNGKGLNVQLRKTGFSYDVWKNNADSTTTYNRVDIDFANANSGIRVVANGKSEDYLNYVEEKISQVHHYSSITYKNVWKNIDVQFVLSGDKPKYNFIIHKGGKLADVKLAVNGAKNIMQKSNGLILSTNLANIEESVPHSYYTAKEQKTTVHASFIKDAYGNYGLNVKENIPANAELVIDPVPTLLWSTYYGG